MLFNGKYYNKPGHLGMTTEELKAALEALPTPEAGDAGKPVVVNEDGDGYVLGEAGGGETEKSYIHTITVRLATQQKVITQIINKDNTPFTFTSFKEFLANNGFTKFSSTTGEANDKGYPVISEYPYFRLGSNDDLNIRIAVAFYVDQNKLYVYRTSTTFPIVNSRINFNSSYDDYEITEAASSFTDNIIEL